MLKKGEYGLYKGKEYSLIFEPNKRVTLRTLDKSALDEGFQIAGLKKAVYIKEIDWCELDDAYEYIPYALYKKQELLIIGLSAEDHTVTLQTADDKLGQELGFSSLGKYEFIKTVDLGEITIINKKK
ncbi:hypothetical protein RFW18_16205 [Metabacillus idriensis]|uniref:hypothetical protein n=1 Tax=Metabacillus idriensis TaxID=324768 RepID=UPI0028137596|nr:hypothetical protein [Metabacillus idriensis]MDR0139297.1 hypothetical protein [Metabacillus idriensis]